MFLTNNIRILRCIVVLMFELPPAFYSISSQCIDFSIKELCVIVGYSCRYKWHLRRWIYELKFDFLNLSRTVRRHSSSLAEERVPRRIFTFAEETSHPNCLAARTRLRAQRARANGVWHLRSGCEGVAIWNEYGASWSATKYLVDTWCISTGRIKDIV